jgi:hypothetical protein
MGVESEAEHILALSRELLDDIELDKLPSDKLLLKANRLARLSGSEEVRKWLSFEMSGYYDGDPVSLKYMSLTGRWVNFAEKKGYWGPLAQQQANLEALKSRLEGSKLTSLSGDALLGAINVTERNQASLTTSISVFAGIQSRVLGLLHTFVAGVYYERQFAKAAETTFELYKRDVDALIAEKAGGVLEKFPTVIARLREGDSEAVSQALTTCRRILEAFADSVYPPTPSTYELGGNQLKLDASKHQNRLNVYIAERTESSSRRTRLRQNLSNLFDRVSTGVHNDVTTDEAYALFLNVYLFLGEVIRLTAPKDEATADA